MKQYYFKDQAMPSGVSFEHNGLAYPWNWFDLASAEDLKTHGFTVVEETETPLVPQTVTPRQARLVLNAAGLLDTVEQKIASADKAVQISWEFANEINRTDPIIVALKDSIGLSDAQVDALFVQAAAL